MKLNLKNVFLSVGIAVFALTLFSFSANKAEAVACNAVTGNWNTVGTWSCGHVPLAADEIVIPHNVVVHVDTAAVATTVTLNNTGSASTSLIFDGANSLTVSGAVNVTAPSGVSGTNWISVGGGTLHAGALNITAGADPTEIASVTVSTGTIDVNGNLTFAGTTSAARLTSSGASLVTISGNLTSGGTIDATGSTFTFDGAAAQTVSPYTFNNLTINNSHVSDTVVLSVGTTIVGGNLIVNDGIFALADSTFSVTGTTGVVAGAVLSFSSAIGLKTFTGGVTVAGVWNETAAVVVTFAGSLTNNATSWTASTGVHTFSGATKNINGTTATSIPSVSISGTITKSNTNTLTVGTLLTIAGTLTNNGTVTATTALDGVGSFINGATTGVLNIGFSGFPGISTLDATAADNTVSYTASGANCKATTYSVLVLSGGGAVVCATTAAKDITFSSVTWSTSSSITLTGTLSVAAGTLTNAGGWTLSAPTISVAGTLTNAGTVTSSTLITVAGTYNNNGTTTATTALRGVGSFVNGATGTLNFTGDLASFDVSTLTVDAVGNTVDYNKAGAQTVRQVSYSNLTLSGSGDKDLTPAITVVKTLTITGAKAKLSADSTAHDIVLGNVSERAGTWGSSASSLLTTYVSDSYFSTAGTKKLTVATGRKVYYNGDINNTPTEVTTTSSSTTTVTTTPTTTTTTTVTTTPTTPGGLIITAVPPTTTTTTVTTTEKLCPNGMTLASNCSLAPTTTTTTTTYNFGTTTLKNGSRGEAVMELQRFLNAKLNLGLVVDGKLGPKTIAVIKKWQRDNGLVADGLIGAKTKLKMNSN